MNNTIKDYPLLVIAGIINAIGVTLVLTPLNLLDSGISGTSFLFYKITGITMSVWLILLNVPFYILGLKRLGKEFIIKSLVAIVSFSSMTYILNNLPCYDLTMGSPITQNDILISALLGGAISGCGSGLVIRFGGAIDGVEVLAVLFAKKLSLSVGMFVMIYNVCLYIISALVLNNWIIPLYSILTYCVSIKIVDFIVDGLDKAKAVFIITNRSEKVADTLSKQLGRGVTVIQAQGYFSQEDKVLLYCVINRFEVSMVKRLVTQMDSSAFVTISDVTETVGGKYVNFSSYIVNQK